MLDQGKIQSQNPQLLLNASLSPIMEQTNWEWGFRGWDCLYCTQSAGCTVGGSVCPVPLGCLAPRGSSNSLGADRVWEMRSCTSRGQAGWAVPLQLLGLQKNLPGGGGRRPGSLVPWDRAVASKQSGKDSNSVGHQALLVAISDTCVSRVRCCGEEGH